MEQEKQKSSARRNIYFSKENMDLYDYLNNLGYKGSTFACLAIRRLIEESLTEEEINNIESPSNDMLLLKMNKMEEKQMRKQELMMDEIIKQINRTIFSEISALKTMIIDLQNKIKQGVVVTQPEVENDEAMDGYELAEMVSSLEMSGDVASLLEI